MVVNETPNSIFERNPGKTIFLFSFIFLIIFLCIAEVFCRLFLPEWAPPRSERAVFGKYDSLLGWAYKPGKTGQFVHQNFSVTVSINSQGLRDKEYTLLDRNNNKRMLILGDSFGWGFGVEQNQVFSEILEERNPIWEIINASVSGYSTAQQFLYFKEKGILYNPDIVLLLFYKNDFWENIHEKRFWFNAPHFRLIKNALEQKNIPVPKPTMYQNLQKLILGETYFFRKMAQNYLSLKLFFLNKNVPVLEEVGQDRNSEIIMRRLLSKIIKLSAEIGARFILVSIPMKLEHREILREITDSEKVSYLALDDYFSQYPEPRVFPHDGRWNPRGHKLAADIIGTYLKDLRVFN